MLAAAAAETVLRKAFLFISRFVRSCCCCWCSTDFRFVWFSKFRVFFPVPRLFFVKLLSKHESDTHTERDKCHKRNFCVPIVTGIFEIHSMIHGRQRSVLCVPAMNEWIRMWVSVEQCVVQQMKSSDGVGISRTIMSASNSSDLWTTLFLSLSLFDLNHFNPAHKSQFLLCVVHGK